jgi:membrane-anchored protein YejM (alkaline phosphatase superfamily)
LEEYPKVKVKVPADIYPPRIGKPKYSREKEQWVQGENGLPVLKDKRFSGRTVSGKFIHGTDLHSLERQYHQGVLAIDEGVGKLIKALKDTGQYKNTLIVFGADQGIALGTKGIPDETGTL